MQKYRIVAIVPLRGGSKGIPGKNIKQIAGKPLFAWSIEAALKSEIPDKIVVSTDSPKIGKCVKELFPEVDVLSRPAELASDTASTESVMLHAMEYYDFEHMLLVQVTSPMVTEVDFRKAWRKYEEEKLDSLLTAVRSYRFLWSNDSKPLNYDPSDRPRRQDFGGALVENGAFYITSKDILENNKCRLGGVIGIYEMDERCSREVDSIEDWIEIEKILASS